MPMLIRALCVGGSWSGRYREFDVRRNQTTFFLAPGTLTQDAKPHDGMSVVSDEEQANVYELRSVEFSENHREWFAVSARQSMVWALQQLMFVYACERSK